MTDLDLSRYDHPYLKAVQKNSWATSIYVDSVPTAFSAGSGYVYAMVDLGYTDGETYNTNQWFPSIYVKTYIDKIFEDAGFTYDSAFFNSAFFKQLIVPFNGTTVKQPITTTDDMKFKVQDGSYQLLVGAGTSEPTWDTEIYDVGGHFNLSNGRYTSLHPASLQKWNGVYYDERSMTDVFDGYFEFVWDANIATVSTDYFEFYMGVRLSGGIVGYVGATLYTITNFTWENIITSTSIGEGDSMSLNYCIPKDVLQKDFFNSIVKAFNLYVEPDKDIPTKFLIETRNDYYTNNEIIDWTDKIDYSNPVEVRLLSEVNSREYVYTYKEDKDYYNDLYTKETNQRYGEYSEIIINDFQKGTNTLELIFAPTPMVGSSTSSRVVANFTSVDSSGVATPRESVIRLLYYGGVKSCDDWAYNSLLSGNSIETTYPYAGHLDDPYAPTLDLNFGIVAQTFFIANYFTTNNLFNQYYSKFFEEVTDKDSKLITALFRLTPKDIFILSFRNFIYLDGTYYILNKVIDYDYLQNDLTKVELLKVKTANDYVPASYPAPGVGKGSFGIIEGGEDEVRDIAATSFYTLVEGGEDEVRDIGATSYYTIVNGGQS